jgi:hypothetical protein
MGAPPAAGAAVERAWARRQPLAQPSSAHGRPASRWRSRRARMGAPPSAGVAFARMGALRIAAVSVFACLAGVGGGTAFAAPGFLGRGHDPGVAVDGAGTAHVAWLAEADGGAGSLEYCQVPRGKRACALRRSVGLPEDGVGKVQVLLPRPGTVQIVAPLLQPAALVSSFDGGNTFAVGTIGQDTPAIEKAIYGPGETISLLSGSGPASFGRFNPDGSGPADLPVQFGSATESLETSLAPWGAGFVAFFSGLRARCVLFSGAGDPNLPESWVEGPRLGDADDPNAVGGRSGTWVAYVRRGRRAATYVRRLRSSGRLGPERRVVRDDPFELAFAHGPRGDMALVWGSSDTAMIVRSRTGRRWTRPKRLFRGNDPQDLKSALGPRGGWMVWDSNPGNAGMHPIRIAALPRAPRR